MIYLNGNLQQDNVFPTVEITSLSALTGKKTRKGLTQVVLSNEEIVNVVSNQYGLLANEDFFPVAAEKLTEAGFEYDIRSINRDNGSFVMDYILTGDKFRFSVKGNEKDVIRPFLRFTNSYDGKAKTAGHFGFFRQVCSNGLHVATTKIGFSLKHRGKLTEVVMPNLEKLLFDFMNNEFYSIHRNFEILSDRQCDPKEALRQVVTAANLWKWEASDNNPEPSLNSRMALEIVERETKSLGVEPSLWLVYNALNEVIHTKMKRTFDSQKETDAKVFAMVLEMAN